jgi:hypothetical protein
MLLRGTSLERPVRIQLLHTQEKDMILRYCPIVVMLLVSFMSHSLAQETKAVVRYGDTASRRCAASEGHDVDFSDKAQQSEFFTKATNCISRQTSMVNSRLLGTDQKVVAGAYPEVRAFYSKRGYSAKDAARVSVLAWARYRSKRSSGSLSESSLVDLSQSFGQLTVRSRPPGATIELDGTPWDGDTDETDWTESGKHPVRLTKQGCQAAEGEIQVVAGGSVTFERTLSCGKAGDFNSPR